MGQHRHPAHRVTNQNHRPTRHHHRQDGLQILSQLLDGVGLDRRLAGLTVAALVVEDHPDLIAPALREGGPLEVEGAHALAETVREHDGQRRRHRTDLADDQRYPVGGGHHAAAVGVEELEVLALVGVAQFLAMPQRLRR